jgi:nucleotide-binding universal stress UspA family protein
MVSFSKILVPVDFGGGSRTAVEHAIGLAERFDAQVTLLHVHVPPYYVGDVPVTVAGANPQPLADYIRTQAQSELDALLEDVRGAHGSVSIQGALTGGRVEKEVVRIADEEKYDLVVMGTHGRSGLNHFLLGSVAEQVLRKAPCPVMVVRQAEDEG